MANSSIYNAFERMWQHITTALSNKLSVSGGTMTGGLTVDNNNPYVGLKTTDGEAYFQTYDDGSGVKAGFGYGWSNSLKIDTSGNVYFGGGNRPTWNGNPVITTANTETWTFELEDGSTVTKAVCVG